MITQVILKGFQSHENTNFNLGNGLNVITGPSDAGKTAIIRAIRWVAFNEPQGEAFLNERVGETEVKIILDNGSIITKTRKSGKTNYIIQTDESDEGSVFEKAEVPLEVTRMLGIEKHSFGDFESALNFSFQLDAPFLISETGSAGAKVLGKLAGTESVDLAIKGVSKDTHAARNMRSNAEKDIERLTGDLFEYQHIDDAKSMLNASELLLEKLETGHEQVTNMKEYRHEYMLVREKISKLFELLEVLAHVPVLEEDLKDIEKSQQRYDSLLQLYSDGNRLQERIELLGQELTAYENVVQASNFVSRIEKDENLLLKKLNLRQVYQKHTHDVKTAEETLNKTNELETAAEGLNITQKDVELLDSLRNMRYEYQSSSDELNTLNERLDMFKGIDEVDKLVLVIKRNNERFAELGNLRAEHVINSEYIKQKETAYLKAKHNLQTAEQKLQQAWDSAGGVCPLCESVVCEHGQ